jgi:hypothetical protein
MYPATATTNATYELPKLDPRRRKRTEKREPRGTHRRLGEYLGEQLLVPLNRAARARAQRRAAHAHALARRQELRREEPHVLGGPNLAALRSGTSRRQDTAARPPASAAADQSLPPNFPKPSRTGEEALKMSPRAHRADDGGNLGWERRGAEDTGEERHHVSERPRWQRQLQRQPFFLCSPATRDGRFPQHALLRPVYPGRGPHSAVP